MRRLRQRLGARPVTTGLGTLIAAAMLASLVVMPAFGAPPHEECASPAWNGEYYKVGVDDRHFETTGVETSLSGGEGTINLTIQKQGNTGQVTWSNDTDYGVFRIYEKYGRLADESFAPGASDTFEVQKSISHITFCFGELPDPEVEIVKETNGADHSTDDPNYVLAGDPVTWTYTVTNVGNVPLESVQVSDDQEGPIAAPVSVLEPGEVWVFEKTASADASTSDWDDGALNGYSNTGTVTANYEGTQVTDSDTSGYYASNPSITIDCTVDGTPCEDGVTVNVGESIVWTFDIENTGNVPLSAVVVKQDGTQLDSCTLPDDTVVEDCDLGVLDPGDVVTVTHTQSADPEDPMTTSFTAEGSDPLGDVVDQTAGDISVTVNNEPEAIDDFYEVNERADENEVATLEVPAPGVLGNDTDDDGDALSAEAGNIATSEGGTVGLNSDGSFEYTPALLDDEQWDSLGAFSYVDTWEYTVTDGNGGSDTGTVEVTVNRVICTDETVTASEGDVVGSFTLLSTTTEPCKPYSVDASDSEGLTDDLITLTVPGDGNLATFRGELTFTPQTLDGNDDFVLSLEYDPDNEGPEEFRPLLICESATFVEGLVVDATLPVDETWCNAGWTSRASGGGEIVTVIQVFGEEDPGFSFR